MTSSTTLALVDDLRPDAATTPLNDQQTAIQLMLDLEAAGMLTPVALNITDPSLPYDKAEALATFIGSVNRRCSWYVGDFGLYCEAVYGEPYAQLMAATGLSEQTIMHRMFVAKNVPPERRVATLSFSTHALVARKPAAEQAYWLNEAATRGWGYVHLRDAMQHVRREEQPPLIPPDPPEPSHDTVINVAVLLDAAQAVIRDGTPDGEFVRIPVESFDRLRAAFNGAL